MDFIDSLRQFSARAATLVGVAKTEEATKLAFVLPFIKALGYNYSDPNDVIPEYSADIGNKNMDKVDFAIMSDGKPIFLLSVNIVELTT